VSTRLRPLRPSIRLRIGVSGHRVPPKLPAEAQMPVRAAVDRVVKAAVAAADTVQREFIARWPRDGEPDSSAKFVVVSSLAEGSDRIVAESGLAAGFALEAVLPFARAEYARDFKTPESRADFERLLTRAASVFELAGPADARARAYEAAGLVMLANIDLLIAIWDGKEADGFGGTAEIVGHAVGEGIPVVWVDPADPQHLRFSWSRAGEVPPARASAEPSGAFKAADDSTIEQRICEILRPPSAAPGSATPLDIYLAEKEQRWNLCPWYSLLQLIFAGRRPRASDFHLPEALEDSRNAWQEHYFRLLPPDTAQRPAIESILLPAFSIADHLAVYYSYVYRSAYVFNFAFAAFATALALIDILYPGHGYLVWTELGVIVLILLTWHLGTRRGWHRRWLEYRRLAECLRHMRILAPVGSGGALAHPGHGLDADEQDWVNWYAWSVRRLLPLPNRVVDDGYVTAVRDAVLTAEISGQRAYHEGNIERMTRLNEHIEATGKWVFVATLAVCVIMVWHPPAEPWEAIVAGLTALLPTAGAAFGAIHVHGEFQTAAEQSQRTERRLAKIDEFLQSEAPDFARLTDRIEHASRVMMADLRDWQTVFSTRRLARP
jgi:hypothetical protein